MQYYLVVDGYNGTTGDYRLDVACSPCVADEWIACGSDVRGYRYDMPGLMNAYPCTANDESGAETVYVFEPREDGNIRAVLDSAGPDILVLADQGSGCDPTACIAFGDREVQLAVTSATTYYLVVDGAAGTTGGFTLSLDCEGCEPMADLACGDTHTWSTAAAGSTARFDTYPDCYRNDLSGPEIAYRFTAADARTVQIGLTTLRGDPDLLVLEERGAGCDRHACIDSVYDGIFDTAAGQTYYLVVDSSQYGPAEYTLHVACDCEPAGAVQCGVPVVGDTDAGGSTRVLASYPSCVYWDESGPEAAYTFAPTADADVQVDLVMGSSDLDLFVLRDGGAGCRASTCIAFGDQSAVFRALAGEAYFVVVDGYSGYGGPFALDVQCR